MTTRDKDELHELAGGWISERKGTPIPGFLKLAYVAFSLFGLAYLFQYASGEVDHATRGPLVRQINAAMDAPSGVFLGAIGVILVAFVLGLLWFALVRKEADE